MSKTDNDFWGDSPSQFAFMLFCAIWSLLVLGYLVASTFFLAHGHQGLVTLTLVGITCLFWFAGSIAMADFIGVPDCDGNNFCQSAQAGVAFGFFIWAIFTALTVLSAMSFMGGRGATVDSTRKPHQPYPGV